MTLPMRSGGTTITILHETQDAFGDRTWVDGQTIQGCLFFSAFNTSGRILWRGEQTSSGDDVVTAMRTLYLPYEVTILPTDRVLIHPDGVDSITEIDDTMRRENTYDVMGEPMKWRNGLTGWAPCTEAALLRVY
jgi:hypothetical protein